MKRVFCYGTVAICAALMLLAPLTMRADGYVYANARLAPEITVAQPMPGEPDAATYAWAMCWQYQGQTGGEVDLGDLQGVNFLQGVPLAISSPAPGVAHVEGVGIYNGMPATFTIDYFADTAIDFSVRVGSVVAWSKHSAYDWAGVLCSL